MVALHQILELGLDGVAISIMIEPQRREAFLGGVTNGALPAARLLGGGCCTINAEQGKWISAQIIGPGAARLAGERSGRGGVQTIGSMIKTSIRFQALNAPCMAMGTPSRPVRS